MLDSTPELDEEGAPVPMPENALKTSRRAGVRVAGMEHLWSQPGATNGNRSARFPQPRNCEGTDHAPRPCSRERARRSPVAHAARRRSDVPAGMKPAFAGNY